MCILFLIHKSFKLLTSNIHAWWPDEWRNISRQGSYYSNNKKALKGKIKWSSNTIQDQRALPLFKLHDCTFKQASTPKRATIQRKRNKVMVPCKSTAKKVSFEWSHHRNLLTDSKVRTTLCVPTVDSESERKNIIGNALLHPKGYQMQALWV